MSLIDIVTLDDTRSDIHATWVVLNPLVGRRHLGVAMAIITRGVRIFDSANSPSAMSLIDIVTIDDTRSDIHATRVVLNPLVGRRHLGVAMAIITCVTTSQ
jgi:predicted sugar kinase